MPNVSSVSGLSSFCVFCLMLPVSLDCPLLIITSMFIGCEFDVIKHHYILVKEGVVVVVIVW